MAHIVSPLSRIGARTKGYVLGCLASISYGLNPLFAKPLYALGLDPASVLLYRYIGASVMLAVAMIATRRSFRLLPRTLLPLTAAAVLFAVSSLTLFESYTHMDVGIASTLLYVCPVFVALIMWICYRQRLQLTALIAIVVAMAGIALLSLKSSGGMHSPVGIALVMLSALSYAVYIVIINRSRLRDVGTVALTFYSITIGIAVFVIWLVCGHGIVPLPPTPQAWTNVIGIALFPTVISILTMTAAIQIIGPLVTSILEALEPLTALAIGCLIFGESLTTANIVGAVAVIVAVAVIIRK